MFKRACLLVSACLLAACGGGGGGGGGGYPLRLVISPNPLTASPYAFDTPAQLTANATVTGTAPSNVFYVLIQDASATFQSGPVSVSQVGSNNFEATLKTSALAVGDHSGTLQMRVCGDPQCADVYGVATEPFNISVQPNPSLTAAPTPSTFAANAVIGDATTSWPVSYAVQRIDSAVSLYARVTDASGFLQPADGQILGPFYDSTFQIPMGVPVDAAMGDHSGTVNLSFCRDPACSRMYSGNSPLPYDVIVQPKKNLSPLVALSGAKDWQTLQGDATHSGYVPVSLDPTTFSPRWVWQSPDQEYRPDVLEPVTAGDSVFPVAFGLNIDAQLFALSESDGSVRWKRTLKDPIGNPDGTTDVISGAATDGNSIFIGGSQSDYDSGFFDAFRVSDGGAAFSARGLSGAPAQFAHFEYYPGYPSPYVLVGGHVYATPADGTTYLGIFGPAQSGASPQNYRNSFVRLDDASGAVTAPWDSCTAGSAATSNSFAAAPAIDGQQNAYLATSAGLLQVNSCITIADAASLNEGFGPAIVPGGDVLVVGGGNLVDFDTVEGNVRWSVQSDSVQSGNLYTGNPAVANGVVYVQNSRPYQLEARSASDGHILWTWQAPWSDEKTFFGNVIATANLLFLSTERRVYAIDLSTHKTRWSYPYPGRLALSANGILYVTRPSVFGTSAGADARPALAAINLH